MLNPFPTWPTHSRVGLDIETCDPRLKELGPGWARDGRIVGVSIAFQGERMGADVGRYYPIGHQVGFNYDRENVLRYLRSQAAQFRGELVGANLPYDLLFLEQAGVKFPHAKFRDVLVAEPLINELRPKYSLAIVGSLHGIAAKDESRLVDAATAAGLKDVKGELWKLPYHEAEEYAINDAVAPLKILKSQERVFSQRQLWDIWDLECRVFPVVLRMIRRGVRIDLRRLEEVDQWAAGNVAELLKGTWVEPEDIWKPKAIAKAADRLGIELPKTRTGKPSVAKDVLEKLDEPVIERILRARKFAKLRQFTASIDRHRVGDRLHAGFRQVKGDAPGRDAAEGTVSGRFSSQHPNLQNQPNPEKEPEISGPFRKIFLPDEGGKWCCTDFASQEPRWMIHYASLAGCPGASDMVRMFNEKPRTDLHQMTADMAGITRKQAKIIFLGLAYGMGGGKLCRNLGLPVVEKRGRQYAGREGLELLEKYHRGAPWLKPLDLKCQARASRRGYVKTAGGRHLHFPRYGGEFKYVYRALNKVIQGSSADQMKKAMCDLFDAGWTPQLTVHDEVDLTVENEKEAREINQMMIDAMKLRVPVCTDLALGPNWGELTEIEQ